MAIPTSQRALLTLVPRRLLASSSFAIAGTLRALAVRLEAIAGATVTGHTPLVDAATSDDFDGLDELTDEFTPPDGPDTAVAAPDPDSELAELRRYVALAESIEGNAKGTALLSALEAALGRATELGAACKAVVFTESSRTQEYLVRLLEANGYAGQVVFVNGQNSDPISRARYEAWRDAHAGTDVLSGSRAADTRAAIIDAFRHTATILVATEAAAEGVNLQCCSLVVHYDLPWNPQRIEQRIGRCHRYGQQQDVAVLSLVNTANAADKRVFDLLSAKFRLFEGAALPTACSVHAKVAWISSGASGWCISLVARPPRFMPPSMRCRPNWRRRLPTAWSVRATRCSNTSTTTCSRVCTCIASRRSRLSRHTSAPSGRWLGTSWLATRTSLPMLPEFDTTGTSHHAAGMRCTGLTPTDSAMSFSGRIIRWPWHLSSARSLANYLLPN